MFHNSLRHPKDCPRPIPAQTFPPREPARHGRHTQQCPGPALPAPSRASPDVRLCPFLIAAPTGEDVPLLLGAAGSQGATEGKEGGRHSGGRDSWACPQSARQGLSTRPAHHGMPAPGRVRPGPGDTRATAEGETCSEGRGAAGCTPNSLQSPPCPARPSTEHSSPSLHDRDALRATRTRLHCGSHCCRARAGPRTVRTGRLSSCWEARCRYPRL